MNRSSYRNYTIRRSEYQIFRKKNPIPYTPQSLREYLLDIQLTQVILIRLLTVSLIRNFPEENTAVWGTALLRVTLGDGIPGSRALRKISHLRRRLFSNSDTYTHHQCYQHQYNHKQAAFHHH